MTLEPSHPPEIGASMSSVEATRVRRIAAQSAAINQNTRALAVSSSALLMRFARELWCEKIQQEFAGTLPGLGTDSEAAWRRLVTLSSPLDFERVALGRSTSVTGCSCSLSWPTPTATDWKGGKARKPGMQVNFRDVWKEQTGQTYPPPEVSAAVQGFPPMWAKCEESETPSSPK